MDAKLIIKNFGDFRRQLETADKSRLKAASTAMRIEAYRLRQALKSEIKAGDPGGIPFAPLSIIARAVRKDIERKPLAKLATKVRYWQTPRGISIGFNAGSVISANGAAYKSNQLSRSWIRIARKQQEGFNLQLPPIARVVLRHEGARLKKQGWAGEAKYYFLRKTTTVAHVPARNIIEPFWAAHRAGAAVNIVKNFNRKMRGEKI